MLFAQSWTYKKGGDAFDGTYKTSLVVGKGSEFPYQNPKLVINVFDNEKDDINFYLSGAGFFQEDTGLSIKWVFDNEPNTVYTSYSWSLSTDGEIIFFSKFNNSENKSTKLSTIEIINKLTKANKVNIRVSNNYGQNDLAFSLSGSTKAINFVIPVDKREGLLMAAKQERDKLLDEIKEKEVLLKTLYEKLDSEMFEENTLKKLKNEIKEDLGLGVTSYSKIDDVNDIDVVGNGLYFDRKGKVDVYYLNSDGSNRKIYGDWYVLKDAPVYKRNNEIKESVKSLLTKYKYEKLISHLTDEVLEKANSSKGFPINSIDEIKIILSKFQYGKFWSCKLNIYLNDGSVVTTYDTYIYSSGKVEISKSELKKIGGKANTEF